MNARQDRERRAGELKPSFGSTEIGILRRVKDGPAGAAPSAGGCRREPFREILESAPGKRRSVIAIRRGRWGPAKRPVQPGKDPETARWPSASQRLAKTEAMIAQDPSTLVSGQGKP